MTLALIRISFESNAELIRLLKSYMLSENMDIATFNYIESALWFGIALFILATNFKNSSHNPFSSLQYRAVATFILFGVSDIIEASTGAWWKPTWLLFIKVICVVSIVWLLVSYIKIKKNDRI